MARLSREIDLEEEAQRSAATDAVARVVSCFTSDPDSYDVRAAVVFRPPDVATSSNGSELLVAQLLFRDEDRADYFTSLDPWYIVREVIPAANPAEAGKLAAEWIGPSCNEVSFDFIPGLYQYAFVGIHGESPPPITGAEYMWFLPCEDPDMLVVRPFPSGFSEAGPPIGEVGFLRMPRAAAEEILRGRGW
jgi:hypothetical protein